MGSQRIARRLSDECRTTHVYVPAWHARVWYGKLLLVWFVREHLPTV